MPSDIQAPLEQPGGSAPSRAILNDLGYIHAGWVVIRDFLRGVRVAAQLRRLQAGLSILATVGATAPFVGLFGTVWGIMNSFSSIAAAKDTSLAVVAPGIAEALLATAIGLAAAIPAVIFYNLANVFLSNCFDRLTMAASRYAKSVA